MSRGQRFQTYSAQQIIDALADRFAPPAYAFLPQVRDSTGYSSNPRTADALAMSLWPSRGLELHGFEVKVGRNDWLRELKNPAKAEAIGQFCHRWWIVAPDKLIELAEVPPLWGLLVARGKTGRLVQLKAAPAFDATPIDTPFLAAILRRAAADCPYARRKTSEYADGVEAGKREADRFRGNAAEDLAHLRERLKVFEEASGVKIEAYTPAEKIGAAVRVLTDSGRIARFVDEADRVATFVETQARRARETADELATALNGKAPP